VHPIWLEVNGLGATVGHSRTWPSRQGGAKGSKLEFDWAPIKAGWGWLAEWVAGAAVHAMQWTEMAPPCRFDIVAQTVMAFVS
jgi:hypothetical protein